VTGPAARWGGSGKDLGRLACVTGLGLVLSCAGGPPWFGGRGCGVVPVASGDIPATTRLRAHVRVEIGGGNGGGNKRREMGFELIARRHEEELVVVGLAPQGKRLFAVRQRGHEFEIDDAGARHLRYLALWSMDALHRGVWIEPPADATADPTGNAGAGDEPPHAMRWVREGEDIVEIATNIGRRRDFRSSRERARARADVDVAPVSIAYHDASPPGSESDFEIRNTWCGYDAALVFLDDSLNDSPDDLPKNAAKTSEPSIRE